VTAHSQSRHLNIAQAKPCVAHWLSNLIGHPQTGQSI